MPLGLHAEQRLKPSGELFARHARETGGNLPRSESAGALSFGVPVPTGTLILTPSFRETLEGVHALASVK